MGDCHYHAKHHDSWVALDIQIMGSRYNGSLLAVEMNLTCSVFTSFTSSTCNPVALFRDLIIKELPER